MNDAFNNPINEGDVVAYAVRRGSRMWLRRIKVTSIGGNYIRGYDLDDVRLRYKTVGNMGTVIGAASLTTQSAPQDCSDPTSF